MINDFNNTTNSTDINDYKSKNLNYIDIIIIFGFSIFIICFCSTVHYSRRHTKYTTVNVVKPNIIKKDEQ